MRDAIEDEIHDSSSADGDDSLRLWLRDPDERIAVVASYFDDVHALFGAQFADCVGHLPRYPSSVCDWIRDFQLLLFVIALHVSRNRNSAFSANAIDLFRDRISLSQPTFGRTLLHRLRFALGTGLCLLRRVTRPPVVLQSAGCQSTTVTNPKLVKQAFAT